MTGCAWNFIADSATDGMSGYVKVFGRRLTSEGRRGMLGGRRLKTSKGRNRESEGRPRGPIYGDLANAVGGGGASGMAN